MRNILVVPMVGANRRRLEHTLALGESISAGQWLTYLPIWLAVLVLIYEGFKHLVRQRRY